MELIGAFRRSASLAAPGEEEPPLGATAECGQCEVRSETDPFCYCPEAVEILGVRFCDRCSREQEAYFRIGELTQVPRGNRTWPSHEVRVEWPRFCRESQQDNGSVCGRRRLRAASSRACRYRSRPRSSRFGWYLLLFHIVVFRGAERLVSGWVLTERRPVGIPA
jgi:hypothetical protein